MIVMMTHKLGYKRKRRFGSRSNDAVTVNSSIVMDLANWLDQQHCQMLPVCVSFGFFIELTYSNRHVYNVVHYIVNSVLEYCHQYDDVQPLVSDGGVIGVHR